jgi:hypothetical protein
MGFFEGAQQRIVRDLSLKRAHIVIKAEDVMRDPFSRGERISSFSTLFTDRFESDFEPRSGATACALELEQMRRSREIDDPRVGFNRAAYREFQQSHRRLEIEGRAHGEFDSSHDAKCGKKSARSSKAGLAKSSALLEEAS